MSFFGKLFQVQGFISKAAAPFAGPLQPVLEASGSLQSGIGSKLQGNAQAKVADTRLTDAFSARMFQIQQRVLAGETDPAVLRGFQAEADDLLAKTLGALIRPQSKTNLAFTDLYPRVRSQIQQRLGEVSGAAGLGFLGGLSPIAIGAGLLLGGLGFFAAWKFSKA